MMSDDLDSLRLIDGAMAMMKMEALAFPRFHHRNVTAQLPIVISRDNDRLAVRSQILQKLGRFPRRGFVVNKVAENDQPARFVFMDQSHQTLGNRRHPPHGHETAGGALAEFVTEMQIGHGEPAFPLVEKREPAIEQDFIGNECLIRA